MLYYPMPYYKSPRFLETPGPGGPAQPAGAGDFLFGPCTLAEGFVLQLSSLDGRAMLGVAVKGFDLKCHSVDTSLYTHMTESSR